MTKNYYEDLAQLRRDAADRQLRQQHEHAQRLNESIKADERLAAECLADGDRSTAEIYAEQINETQSELNQVLAQLPPPQPSLSPAKQRWVEQRLDLVGHPQAVEVAGKAHNYVTGYMGIEDDSEEYFSCMGHLLEPAAYQPMPTPDDIVETLRKTSKYGADLKPSEYNRQVERLWNAKKTGAYKDKQ